MRENFVWNSRTQITGPCVAAPSAAAAERSSGASGAFLTPDSLGTRRRRGALARRPRIKMPAAWHCRLHGYGIPRTEIVKNTTVVEYQNQSDLDVVGKGHRSSSRCTMPDLLRTLAGWPGLSGTWPGFLNAADLVPPELICARRDELAVRAAAECGCNHR